MAMQNHKGYEPSPFRRDKERISRRFQMNLEAIISKYDRPFADSDVLDLSNMTLVENRGFLDRIETVKIGTAKLAADKASSRWLSGFDWNSTKDSTDSAFGSTRCSETDDTSGTDNNYQTQRLAGIEEEQDGDEHEDYWTSHGSHSDDSGNEDADSDTSGFTTPHKSLLYSPVHHQRNLDTSQSTACVGAKGNLSQRFDAEDRRKRAHGHKKKDIWSGVGSLEEEDDDDDDLHNLQEEFPSILEEKKRFVSKMQSILVDSFIDGDDVDEMNSQTEDETSAGTVESSETSGPLLIRSTLKTILKQASKTQSDDPCVDIDKEEISKNTSERVSGRDSVFSSDSDLTDSSTILAGNLNGRKVVCPSKLIGESHPSKDSESEMPSQPPFEAVCNSTMLSELNPLEVGFRVNCESTNMPMGQELLFNVQGAMYLREVPQNNQTGSKQDTRTTMKNEIHTIPTFKLRKCDDHERDFQIGDITPRKPYTPSRKCSQGESTESSPSITPKTKSRISRASRQLQTGFSSPRFNTDEIKEIFKSPKPLVIPGLDFKNLDLTPRRKVRQEAPTLSSGSLRNVLLRLQSPKTCPKNGESGSQKAKGVQPCSSNSKHEMTLVVEDQQLLDAKPEEASSWGDCGVHPTGYPRDQDLDHDEVMENIHLTCMSPVMNSVSEQSACAGENEKLGSSSHKRNVGQIISNSAKKIKAPPRVNREHPQPTCDEKSCAKDEKHLRGGRLVPEVKRKKDCPSVKKRGSGEKTPNQPEKVSMEHSIKAAEGCRNLNISPKGVSKGGLSGSKQSASRHKEPTIKASVHPHQNSRQTLQEDALNIIRRGTETKKYPQTPSIGKSPSTLFSALTQMSPVSPPEFQNHKKVLERRRSGKSGSTEDNVTTPVKWSTKPKPGKNHTKRKSKDEKMKLNRTHMTILASDDSSEEKMEVDPYSLTADDSSPSPRFHQFSSKPLSSSTSTIKSSTKQFSSPYPRNRVQSRNKDVAGDQEMLLMKTKRDSEGRNNLKRDGHSCASRPSDSHGFISRHLDDEGKCMKRPNSQSKDHTDTSQNLIDVSTNTGHDDSTALTRHQQSRIAQDVWARRDHSQYFSEDECNSSGDDAKFLTSIPRRSRHKEEFFVETHSDLSRSPKNRKFYVSENAGALKHKTAIKCGKIISSPKSVRSNPTTSPNFHKTCSSTQGHMTKTKRMLLNSPAKTPKRATSHSKTNRRAISQNWALSPSRCQSEFSGDEALQLSISSPLRANTCNVSASYSCKGPRYCTKPFCFNCALTEAR